MDSHFINFDGRSVHDMIELLLAASGDPEAIARLQQAIQTVDAKFVPVDTELARLEEDKQDTGNYITDNVDGTTANISKALIGNVDSGYDIQINNSGEGQVDVDWLRFIFKGSTTKQIAATIRRNGSWETAARWTADEDTGWIDLKSLIDTTKYQVSNGQASVRVKNGMGIFVLALKAIGNIPVAPDYELLLSLPDTVKAPSTTFPIMCATSMENFIPPLLQLRENKGLYLFNSNQIPANTWFSATIPFFTV